MLRNMIKGAVAFFAIGVLVGFAIPAIAMALGAPTLVTMGVTATQLALFQGSLFGIFGFLAPPFQKLCGGIFGDPDSRAASLHSREHNALKEEVAILEAREQKMEQTLGVSPRLQSIVSRGPRGASFAEAEEKRAAETHPGSPTIH
jgi:hypothetical protein